MIPIKRTNANCKFILFQWKQKLLVNVEKYNGYEYILFGKYQLCKWHFNRKSEVNKTISNKKFIRVQIRFSDTMEFINLLSNNKLLNSICWIDAQSKNIHLKHVTTVI